MNLVFIGMPGAGKGTYADIIAEKYHIPHLSTGEIIRSFAAKGDKLGLEAVTYSNRGVYVPDEIVVGLIQKRLQQPDCKGGFILDSFPGNVAQAEAIKGSIKMDRVFFFNATQETLMDRLSGRFTCRKCGAIYHIRNVKPKKQGVCDICGGELYMREDQKPEVVKQRLDTYEKQLAPLITFFKKDRLLVEIDSNPPIEEKEKVLAIIEANLKHTR